MDDPLEGSHDFAVIFSKSRQGPSLMLQNVHNRVDGMAILKLSSERVIDQFEAGLFLIALKGSVEEQLESSIGRTVHCIIQIAEMCKRRLNEVRL